jgi:hypothetical protein
VSDDVDGTTVAEVIAAVEIYTRVPFDDAYQIIGRVDSPVPQAVIRLLFCSPKVFRWQLFWAGFLSVTWHQGCEGGFFHPSGANRPVAT